MSGSEFFTRETLDAGLVLVRLARPDALNAMTVPMVEALRAEFERLDRDPDCRVIVLTGEGRGFCAGLDLKAVLPEGGEAKGSIEWMRLQEAFAGLILAVRRARQPVIAAVNGAAVGAGLGLALAADIRVADAGAKFLIGAVRIGITAGECGISYHLPRLVGAGRAFEIMLTGRPVGAEEALRIGLVTQVAEGPALLETALDVARQIAANSPYAVKHSKQVMWANLEAPSLEAALQLENHTQVVGLLTEDFTEAARAFAEKRAPVFRGR